MVSKYELSNLVEDISVYNIIINDSAKAINRLKNTLEDLIDTNHDISEDYVNEQLINLYSEYKALAITCERCAEIVDNCVNK